MLKDNGQNPLHPDHIVKSSDEVSYTLIGEPGQTRVKLEYRKLEIVIQESFK